MDQDFDARGNKAPGREPGIDARGIDAEPDAPRCLECGAALRASGPGRRPVYCGRACSSKAYRRRRAEGQQDAVADALIASRVETPDGLDGGARELMELAQAVQRSAARYLERLEQARRGEGDDPRCNQALQSLETGVTGAAQRLLRKAHVLRYEMTAARLEAARTAAEATAPLPAESSRVESSVAAAPTGTAGTPSVGAAPASVANPRPAVPATRHHISPRVESNPPAPAPAPRPQPATTTPQPPAPTAVPVEELRLALAAERSSTNPLLRRLGAPTGTRSANSGTVLVESWDADPRVLAVRRPDRRLVGWIERADNGNGWAVFIDGRAVVDAADSVPWLAGDVDHAVTLLLVAVDQQLATPAPPGT